MPTELKVVMFTDQVSSTARTARRTSAENEEVDREQDRLTAEVLRLTRGALLKDTGDGCYAQFPSVLRAAQAGVLLQERVADRNAAQADERMRFELHVGIDAGELIVLEGDLKGDAANRCARVCSACPAGHVYLSETAAKMLKPGEVETELVGALPLKGIEGESVLYRVTTLRARPEGAANPFIWRGPVTRAEDFFDREQEQRVIRAYLGGRQNCQLVGPRGIGKASLLRQVERAAPAWNEKIIVAYLDMTDPRCFTLSGWLRQVSRQFGWPSPAATLMDLIEGVDTMTHEGLHPVLCLDEFTEFGEHREEFTRDFFVTLRACGHLNPGMSIVTASDRPLSQVVEPGEKYSTFYGSFPILRLGPFNEADARDFVNLHRPGVPSFTPAEREAILDFARRHPLALQVACFHVLGARRGGTVTTALRDAADDMKAHLTHGW